jgi:hypothetical protein
LAYESQQQGPAWRNIRRSSKIQMRLDGSPEPLGPIPEKLRGMWRLAGLVTLEICALTKFQLNYANIIALPVLLGIGVAFKIHYVTRTHLSLTAVPGRPASPFQIGI